MNTRWLNFFERVLWTLIQAASAEGILSVWESLHGPLPTSEHASLVVTLTTVLAVIKNAAAQLGGSPTGATLPNGIRPVPAEATVTVNQVQSAVEAAVTAALTSLIAPTVANAVGVQPEVATTTNLPSAAVSDNAAGPGQIPATPAADTSTPAPSTAEPNVPAVDSAPKMPSAATTQDTTDTSGTISGVI